MSETRKLAAILVADVVGYSRLAGADEDRTLARLRGLRSDLIDPAIAAHHGRTVKRTGDGSIIEFRSVVDAVGCAIEVQNGLLERNAGVLEDRRIEFRVGIYVGDVVEESDGDLMGDGVNIAARLEGVAKPGAICLSEDAYRQVKSRLDLKVSDLGATQLKNIAEPIHVYSLEVGVRGQPKPVQTNEARPPAAKGERGSRRWPAVAAALVIAAIAVATYGWGTGLTTRLLSFVDGERVASSRPLSLVVLPFANLGGDFEQEYFADGVTENLTTELSRIPRTFVIAHNTAMTYKGKNVDAKEIGTDLGVRYVLEGSVQRDQNRVRVNVQLIDAETGAQLLADRFEENVADLFKLQDDVVARLANPLRVEIWHAEAQKAARSKNPESIDFVMRGIKLVDDPPFAKDKLSQARIWFDKALNVDPDNSDALAWKAWSYLYDYWFGWTSNDIDYDAMILGETDRAITLDRSNVVAYAGKAAYLATLSRFNDAHRVVDAGLAIDPNFEGLLAVRAQIENSEGWQGLARQAQDYSRHFEQAKADLEQVIRLSPHDPFLGPWRGQLASAELGLGQIDAAIQDANKAIDGGNRTWSVYLDLAAARVLKGEIEEAKAPLAEARRLNPKLSVKSLALQPAIEGLRKAGLPEE